MFAKPHCAVYLLLSIYYFLCWMGWLSSSYEPLIVGYLALALSR